MVEPPQMVIALHPNPVSIHYLHKTKHKRIKCFGKWEVAMLHLI